MRGRGGGGGDEGRERKVGGGLSHLYMTVFLYNFAIHMVLPAITDVTMEAICPGLNECSSAIYLTGFQQTVIGLGTLVMMPLMGNLSDLYGRKALLTVPMALTIIPIAILAYNQTIEFFYAYYVFKTLTAMVCEGSFHCLSLTYAVTLAQLSRRLENELGLAILSSYHKIAETDMGIGKFLVNPSIADNVPENRRASVFGIISGIGSCAFVCGNLSTRFLSTPSVFQVAASVGVLASVYMKIFLPESINVEETNALESKLLDEESPSSEESPSRTKNFFRGAPSVEDTLSLLKISKVFSQVAFVAFLNNVGDVGLHTSLMYYLKACFHFDKDDFANLMMMIGITGTVSQLVLMPLLVPAVGEEKLLSVALFFNCVHMFLYSIAWSSWIPYCAAMFSILTVFSHPCLRSITSKQVGPNEQGKAQGCISGISSFANVMSPLAFSPLTALFLSKDPPFHFPGFSIMLTGFAVMAAFAQSLVIRSVRTRLSGDKLTNVVVA